MRIRRDFQVILNHTILILEVDSVEAIVSVDEEEDKEQRQALNAETKM